MPVAPAVCGWCHVSDRLGVWQRRMQVVWAGLCTRLHVGLRRVGGA